MPLSDDDIHEILRLIDESDVAELHIETEAFSLHVVRGDAAGAGTEPDQPPRAAAPEASRPHVSAGSAVDAVHGETPTQAVHTISAPMLGTFYRAQAPGAPPFVDEGTQVEPDTIVGLIEVMKMMNPVPAGVVGTIVEVCAENAQLVEHGEPLFHVRGER